MAARGEVEWWNIVSAVGHSAYTHINAATHTLAEAHAHFAMAVHVQLRMQHASDCTAESVLFLKFCSHAPVDSILCESLP